MRYLLVIMGSILMNTNLYSQGCSDAGFCSLGILKNNVADSTRQSLAIGFNYGNGQGGTNIYGIYMEYKYKAGEHIMLQAKINGAYASGILGANVNAGDIFTTVTYTNKPKAATRFAFLGGIKIPLTTTNDKNKDGKPLPLDYQPSIGTYDIIAGVNYIIKNAWELNAGIQVPVIQVNKNSFFPGEYSNGLAKDFVATNLFRRKTDVLARVGYYINFKKEKWMLKPNLLAIYHAGKDSYIDIYGKRTAIEGSQGITINAGIIATKTFRNNNQLEFIAASPFVTRDVRPDGLTRSAVFNIQYSISF